jgi:prepilin-type N-terminal cleavage/methylation domain-containing protein
MNLMKSHHRNHFCGRRGFTLTELLVVIAVIVILVAVTIPAISSVKKSGDVSKAANDLAGAISQARAYAIANNTYTWVGFFEENGASASAQPAAAGTGRIVVDIVASADGTLPYTATNPSAIPSTDLVQVSRLLRIDDMHLVTFPASGAGGSSPGPAANVSIGDTTPGTPSETPFSYPLTGPAQYTFTKALQFSPRGEARIDNSANPLAQVIELGLQPTYGSAIDTASTNVSAVQVTGVGGDVIIYRR